MMSPVSYQGMKGTHDNNIMAYICREQLRHDKGVSNEGKDQQNLVKC